ncbi:HutD/Ves family protein [Streptacidiphilus fuscans]|uniref:HutD family protein n=1 Tax=Streptacidiphilus fuscans TaxID=2789292 RepID=A0A931B5V7_9ACTN|nr:HutD family protein [Streptacidiphilus fuscans]MBF9070974.1 HutD family protein [Streptacidiphilus fuscans]
MTDIQVLRAADRVASPWKNGGGVTREVASSPSGDSAAGAFDWRVSLADVADGGPFSTFEGIDRVITVVQGEGMALTVDGVETVVSERFQPFHFSGDAKTDCRLLGGPLVDFNVMTRRGAVSATVTFVTEPTALSGTTLVVVFEGAAKIEGIELGSLDAAFITDSALVLEVDGLASVVTIS